MTLYDRPERWQVNPVTRFADQLRRLRDEAGAPSYRELARKSHYSRTALSEAARGDKLPSLAVTLAFVEACGGDTEQWRGRWLQACAGADVNALEKPPQRTVTARPAGSPQEVADGADPERAGCAADAVTIDARKVAISVTHIVGQVQLRYSPWGRAAWGRFEGTAALDRVAGRQRVDILLEMQRGDEQHLNPWRCEYVADYMWCDLLKVGEAPVRAMASVFFDGNLVGTAETFRLSLS